MEITIRHYTQLRTKDIDNLSETEDESKNTLIVPEVDIKSLLEKLNLQKVYEKLEEFQCLCPEIFWNLGDEEKKKVFEESKISIGETIKFNQNYKI